jgi:WD40 repeat protein
VVSWLQFGVLCLAWSGEGRVLEHHADNVYLIDCSADGRTLVTASGDNTAAIWDLATGRVQHELKQDGPVYAAVLSPDGALVATGSGDGYVTIYRVADGKEVVRQRKHADAVYCVAYSRDGKWLASVGGNGKGGDTVCRLWDAATLTLKQELSGHTFPVYGAAFAPDGKTLATSSRDKTVRLWSLPSGECRVLEGHTSDVHRCVYSPDGKLLASASQDGTVRVWDVQQGTCRQVLSVAKRGKPDPFYGVAFSPDGKRLAAVGDDFRLHIWDAGSFQVLGNEKLADDGLYAVTFLPAQQGIAVAGAETVVQLLSDGRGNPAGQ